MSRRKANAAPVARVFVIAHLICVIIPIALIAMWAFADRWAWPDLLPREFSLRGFEEVFSGRLGTGLPMIFMSVGIALATAVLSTIVAALAARAVAHYRWRGRALFGFGVILPFIIPVTVFAMGVQVLFIHAGIARTVPGVVLSHAIVALPYAIIIMSDVTRAAGTRLEDAARSLGAGTLATTLHVTIPAILPGILSSLSMCYIMSFSQYFLTLLIGGGSVRTFAVVLFPYLSSGDRTIAAAYGLTFIVITLAVFLIFELLLKRFGVSEDRNLYG
ncbi:MAG: ABC transporter permease subunit [Eggerthellaceae bacterium]|nr:ABC transporter permease subunit [Eggerthellaceae bacterium]